MLGRNLALVAMLLLAPVAASAGEVVETQRYVGTSSVQPYLWFAGREVPGLGERWSCDLPIAAGQACFTVDEGATTGWIRVEDDFGLPVQFQVSLEGESPGRSFSACSGEAPFDLEGVRRVVVHVSASPFGCAPWGCPTAPCPSETPRLSPSGTVTFARA
jgi:hypothetical protein